MGHLPFAFSVNHFINSVGSDAGFASIIGLAILVLLYFAHARETAAVRDQAEEASRRVQELEARVASLAAEAARQPKVAPAPAATAAGEFPAVARPVAAPVPATAAARAPGVAAAYPVGAPAGVGAPPLTAATRLIPADATVVGAPAATEAHAGSAAPAAPAPTASAASAAPASPVGPPLTPDPLSAALTSEPPPPSAATVAARAGAGPPSPASQAAPAAPAATNGTGEHVLPSRAPATPPAPVQIRSGAGVAATRAGGVPPRRPATRQGPSGFARRALPVLIGALAVAGIVAVLLILTSGGSGTTAASSSTPASNAPAAHHRARPKAFNPASVTVVVLNGTPTTGLARRISDKLGAAGFKQGTPASASDATRQATIVAYLPGHNQDALQVAKALKLGTSQVQKIDPATQAIACPPPSACAATVVVTVGADLANQ